MPHDPSLAVTVCAVSLWFVHITVVPGATVIDAGPNAYSEDAVPTMATPTGALVGVTVGAPVGKLGELVGVAEGVGVAVAVLVADAVGVGAPGAVTITVPCINGWTAQ